MEKIFLSSEYRSRIEHSVCYGEMAKSEEPRKLFFEFRPPNELCDVPLSEIKDRIVFWSTGCGCLQDIVIRENGVEAYFYPGKAHINKEREAYWAYFTMYFKDDKELYAMNNIGQPVLNPDKAQVQMEVYGVIRKQ